MSTKKNITKRDVRKEVKKDLRILNKRDDVVATAKSRNFKTAARRQSKIDKEISRMCGNMSKNIKDHIKVENHCTPQACDLIKLMDDPFNARWEDAKIPWYPGGQPVTSTNIKVVGTIDVTVAANRARQVYFLPSPATRPTENEQLGVESVATFVDANNFSRGMFGCPVISTYQSFDGNGYGQVGCAGWVGQDISLDGSEYNWASTMPPDAVAGTHIATVMPWTTPPQLGNMVADARGKFAYRLVGASIRAVPTSPEVDLGGSVGTTRIAESNNQGYAGNNSAFGKPSAHYQRGAKTIQMNYMRSQTDDLWYHPSSGSTAQGELLTGSRNLMVLSNNTANAQGWKLFYIAIYECKGECAAEVGTVSYSQPVSAGKITTAIAVAQNNDLDAAPKEIEKSVEFVNAKESPVTSNVAKDAKDHKSLFENIEEFVGDVAPIAGKIATTVAALL